MHGAWESFTGFNAPLYKRSNEVGDQALLNVEWAVNYWLNLGAPKEKLVLGLGTYGRSFKLLSPAQTKPGDPASGGAMAGTVLIETLYFMRDFCLKNYLFIYQYTREAGFYSYYEICQKVSQGWVKKFDTEQRVPYANNMLEWVGFDDIQSLKEKVIR